MPGASASRRSTRTAPCSTSGSPPPRSASADGSPAARRADRARRAPTTYARRDPRGAAPSRSPTSRPPPATTEDAWLRLHLLSPPAGRAAHDQRWTASSACSPTSCGPAPGRARSRASSRPGPGCARPASTSPSSASTSSRGWSTTCCPTGVRIADADRVRLGAHLAEGTTVMHEGFVNFNAGTLGASMVEGRISAGVVVGDGSDVGGGASIMGTLSGGGKRGHLDRRALPARRQRRHRHLARRRLRGRGRLLRHRRHQGHRPRPGQRAAGGQGASSSPAPTTCCSAATRSPARSRRCRGRASGIALNAALHAN